MYEYLRTQITFTSASILLLGQGVIAGSITPVVNGLSQAGTIAVFYGVVLSLAAFGTYGLVRDVRRTLRRHKRRRAVTVTVQVLTALLGALLLWIIYDLWWPFNKLFRHFSKLKRLRVVGPIVCTITLLAGIGFGVYNITVFPTFENDTPYRVQIIDCAAEPTALAPGEDAPKLAIGTYSHTCTIMISDASGKNSYGCVALPDHIDDHTVIRFSTYTPLSGGRQSCA